MSLFKNRFVPETYKNSVSDVIPGQAMSANELWERFNRGQRLVINQRPINLYPADEDGNYVGDVRDEDYASVPPDIEDRVDIEEYLQELQEKKQEIKDERERRASAKKAANEEERTKRSEEKPTE